jgi:flagellar basal body-associated protein FliL
MAEETQNDPKENKPSAPSKKPSLGLILGLLNTVSLFGLLGAVVYTQVLYERPRITEKTERKKIEQEFAKPPVETKRALLTFEPIQANLRPSPIGVRVPGGPPQQMKPHFVTMTLSLELTDEKMESTVRERLPQFQDQLLRQLGETRIDEVSTVQGRFLLRSKIAGIMNHLIREARKLPLNAPPTVSNVYFSDFIIQ